MSNPDSVEGLPAAIAEQRGISEADAEYAVDRTLMFVLDEKLSAVAEQEEP